MGREGEGRGVLISCIAVVLRPLTLALPGWSTLGFHRPGRHRVNQARKRREVFGKPHEG